MSAHRFYHEWLMNMPLKIYELEYGYEYEPSTLDSWLSILDSRFSNPIFLRHRQINDQLTELKLMCYWFSVGFCCGSVIADPVGFFEGPANGNLFNLLGQPVPICDCAVFCAACVVQGEVVCFGPTAGKHSKNNLKGKNSVHPKVMENNPRGSYGNLFTLPMAGSINNALKFKKRQKPGQYLQHHIYIVQKSLSIFTKNI